MKREDVKVSRQDLAALGFMVCLQAMTWACGARSATAPLPHPPDPVSASPSAPDVIPAPPGPPPPAAPQQLDIETDACALIAAPGEPVAVVALGDSVDPSNAPRPTNASERLLFRQLYETLVRADCLGHPRPGLAATWHHDANGNAWIVTLRDNARFADSAPVTATDVRASWITEDGELRPDVARIVQSVVIVSDRTLAITLWRQDADAPIALAHPDLAIAKPVAGATWPLGTRSSRVGSDSSASAIMLMRDGVAPIRFLAAPGDPRDVLDHRVDLLLTRDRAALTYAATLPVFQSLPLAWRRTHVLLSPGRASSSPLLSDQARNALAVDAVRGEARGAQGPFWWQTPSDCTAPSLASQSVATRAPRIVYDAGDAAARDLAERIVGLSRTSGPAATAFLDALLPVRPKPALQRATGLTGEELARTVRRGLDAGYVLSIESQPVDACGALSALVDRAPWLDPATIVPLVDTRLHAIVRRGVAGLSMELDGGIVIASPASGGQR
jgi:hypothetical protein